MLNTRLSILLPFSLNTFLYTVAKRKAGHSKWSNIKHAKAIKDAQKSLTFAKLSRQIRIAIQEGNGTNPDFNVQLSQALEQAKKNSMPRATVENAINQAKTSKLQSKQSFLELRGPAGSIFIVSILSDNTPRVKNDLHSIVRKSNIATFSNGGALRHEFDFKGVVDTIKPENLSLEIATDHAIEVGAEDVMQISLSDNLPGLQFVCAAEQFHHVKKKLMELHYQIHSAGQMYIARNYVTLSDTDLQAVTKLCEKLEEHIDVMCLYDNIL